MGYGCVMKLKRRNWSGRNFKALNELLAGVHPGEIAVFDWDNTCICGDIGEALLRRMTFDLAFAMDAKTMAATVPDAIHGVKHVLIQGEPFPLDVKLRQPLACPVNLPKELFYRNAGVRLPDLVQADRPFVEPVEAGCDRVRDPRPDERRHETGTEQQEDFLGEFTGGRHRFIGLRDLLDGCLLILSAFRNGR